MKKAEHIGSNRGEYQKCSKKRPWTEKPKTHCLVSLLYCNTKLLITYAICKTADSTNQSVARQPLASNTLFRTSVCLKLPAMMCACQIHDSVNFSFSTFESGYGVLFYAQHCSPLCYPLCKNSCASSQPPSLGSQIVHPCSFLRCHHSVTYYDSAHNHAL